MNFLSYKLRAEVCLQREIPHDHVLSTCWSLNLAAHCRSPILGAWHCPALSADDHVHPQTFACFRGITIILVVVLLINCLRELSATE
jgi:hypothetical protein